MWNNFLFALKCTLEFQPLFMYFLFLHPFFVCRLKILHFVTIYMDGKHQAHLQIYHQHHQSRSILTWWSSSSSSSLSWMIARLLRSKLKNLQPHQKKTPLHFVALVTTLLSFSGAPYNIWNGSVSSLKNGKVLQKLLCFFYKL